MSDNNTTATSANALNINQPSDTADSKPTVAKRPARKLPNMTEAAKLQKQLDAMKAAKLKLAKQQADVTAKLKLIKPPARSKDSGNTWQIKLIAATMPTANRDAMIKAIKPKLTKNQHGLIPNDATIGTICTDFAHSMRVFKSLNAKQREALLNAI